MWFRLLTMDLNGRFFYQSLMLIALFSYLKKDIKFRRSLALHPTFPKRSFAALAKSPRVAPAWSIRVAVVNLPAAAAHPRACPRCCLSKPAESRRAYEDGGGEAFIRRSDGLPHSSVIACARRVCALPLQKDEWLCTSACAHSAPPKDHISGLTGVHDTFSIEL